MHPSHAPAARRPRSRIVRRTLGLVAVATCAVAAPLIGTGPAAAAPAPAPAPEAHGHGHGHGPRLVVLGNADSGTTVEAAPGTIVAVLLDPTSERFAWSAPASDTATVARSVISTTRSDGGAVALFLVVGTGTANVQAVSSCRPSTTPCPLLGILWRATVHST